MEERAIVSKEVSRASLELQRSTAKSWYDKDRMKLLLNPRVYTQVDSKLLGIYKKKKITIQGVSVSRLSDKEASMLAMNSNCPESDSNK